MAAPVLFVGREQGFPRGTLQFSGNRKQEAGASHTHSALVSVKASKKMSETIVEKLHFVIFSDQSNVPERMNSPSRPSSACDARRRSQKSLMNQINGMQPVRRVIHGASLALN